MQGYNKTTKGIIMYIASTCSFNPITGRKVWLVREIPTGKYGDDWVSSLVVVRRHWASRSANLQLTEGVRTLAQLKAMKDLLRSLGFNQADATRRGRVKRYNLQASVKGVVK